MVAGRETYMHVVWADNMQKLVKGAGVDAGSTYIGQVRKALPPLPKEKVANTYANWSLFLAAVRAGDIEFIKDGADELRREQDVRRALEARLLLLESGPGSPTAVIRQRMAQSTIKAPTAPTPSTPVAGNIHTPIVQ
ncbi:hypothetical protein M422DRAFT_263946 [Sphaerobolus stellatus SS14]|uniref:Uncharacterized protein n=1 Tax=Sphaerobolus stellatus (strain SS14) TaxID=990650 RepID=A0A0C9V9N7_SPHS4|nr:hypothetical protein M422DRAFT_263946 [Sphaerobolus stellatus SS14]